ncbi:inactive transglutaminase family protein [Porticoccus sp.]
MSSKIQIFVVAGILIAIGLGLTLYKRFELGFPLLPGERQDVWTLESKVTVKPTGGPIDISMALPEPRAGWVLLDENFASSGFGFSIAEGADGSRQARWTRQTLDRPATLYYKLQTYRSDEFGLGASPVPDIKLPELTDDRRAAMNRVVANLRERSSGPISFTALLLEQLVDEKMDQDTAFLFAGHESGHLGVIMDVLAYAGIPAQRVKGVFLEEGRRRQQISTLVEVFDDGRWHLFNPLNAQMGLPDNFFVWERGERFILDVIGGNSSQLEFALVKNTLPVKTVLSMEQEAGGKLMLDFSIYSLPVEQQGMFKGLLLIPVGALVVVLLRVLVGIRTSGTFMPILIALGFIQTTLLAGLIIFLMVVGAGLWIRSYLSHLNLLLVARITAVVIMVILLMAALSIVSYKLGFNQALTVTYLPTIILSWTIERMSILWEEDGPHEVLIQGGGSLLAAILAYLLMTVELIEHLTFNFPELMISLLGVVLLLGKYTGYRLSELYRFRYLRKDWQ